MHEFYSNIIRALKVRLLFGGFVAIIFLMVANSSMNYKLSPINLLPLNVLGNINIIYNQEKFKRKIC